MHVLRILGFVISLFSVFLLYAPSSTKAQAEMQISFTNFANHSTIPTQHTCSGADISPALTWSDAPKGTKSFVLVVDDPDAPKGTWVHWVAYNISATTTKLEEGIAPTDTAFKQGLNDFKTTGYRGPCPPRGHGVHRYMFKLYALNTALTFSGPVNKQTLEMIMKSHVLAKAATTATFARY